MQLSWMDYAIMIVVSLGWVVKVSHVRRSRCFGEGGWCINIQALRQCSSVIKSNVFESSINGYEPKSILSVFVSLIY